ncbi:MAG: helix-hairpin-helix domain-containing protein [Nitrospira sp.]|nr:helix-hairpin-helix domain-containing protein [Nitrospira sp.]
MIRSLSLKLAMLAMTIGLVFWVRGQPGERQQHAIDPMDTPSVPMAPSIAETPTQTTLARPSTNGPVPVASGVSNHAGVAGHTVSTLVDLNRATVKELESLPGIGAVLAQRVIDHRTTMGRFLAVEDLREVKGIGSKKFEQIKSLVIVAKGEPKGRLEKRTS